MLELLELRRIFERLGTPAKGRKLVEDARRLAPVRKVQSNSNNVITRFNSRKMARMVDTESRTVEYPAVVMYEHDPTVLEYHAQPVRLDLFIQEDGKLKPSRLQHTPDFLLIREDGFLVEEWREEGRLQRLQKKYPGRFFKDEGGWHYPAIEKHLHEMGIAYRLRSALEHPRTYIQNLIFLADYLDESCPSIGEACLCAMRQAFKGQAGLPLLHLIERGRSSEEFVFTPDQVYKAIADRELYFDLRGDVLSETHRVLVYQTASALELSQRSAMEAHGTAVSEEMSIRQGALVDYDGATYTVARVGVETVTLHNQQCTFDQRISILVNLHQQGAITIHTTPQDASEKPQAFEKLTPKTVDEILTRAKWLEMAETDPESVPRSKRTLQRYRSMMKSAGALGADQKIALASRISERGNRTRKIPERLIELIEEVAKEHYNNPRNIKKTAAYKFFLAACKREGLNPCSQPTFNRELDTHASTRMRKGKRMAYQEAPIVWYLMATEPIHGVRPFQYVHIDHTQLDIMLVGGETRKVLGKPWLTLAIDAESRHIAGFYLSFDAPSYRSCMMVLRDLVRRQGQMPAMLVLDNGKEFHSNALSHMCELHGCSLRFRPGGKPRYGSVMERIFGTTNTQFIHLIEGNTQLLKSPRSVTKSVLPENFAAWTLPQLHGALDKFFFEVYGKTAHLAHGEAPSEHFKRRMLETGERLHRLVRFDENFRIETCPPPSDRPTRIVDGQRGIKVNHIWFWNDVLAGPDLRKQSVQVRMDPWDPGTAFVLVKDKWVICKSKLQHLLSRYTEVERRYVFEELAALMGGQIKKVDDQRLEEWLQILDPKKINVQMAERQEQSKNLYGSMDMTQAVPDTKLPTESGRLVVRPGVKPLTESQAEEADDYTLF